MKKIASVIINNSIIEHLLFIVLLILSVVFYQERLFADSGYYLINVINNNSFWVEHNRFILIFSQILPVVGVKLRLSLKLILLLYSVGHVLFFYAIFLVTSYLYKDKLSGLLLLLLQTLGIMSGFFVPMFELYYGAGLLVLFSSILFNYHGKIDFIITIVLAFFILTGHPYAIFLMLFIIITHLLKYKTKFLNQYIVYVVIIIGVVIFKKFTASEYEQGKTTAFINNLSNANYNLRYIKLLIMFLLEHYKGLLLLQILATVILLAKKKYMLFFVITAATIGILGIINVSYYGFVTSRYQEQVYFPLSFIAAYSFVLALSYIKKQNLQFALLGLAYLTIIVRVTGIIIDGNNFTDRVNDIKQTIEYASNIGGDKFIIRKDELKNNPNWSYPIESILFSSMDNGKTITVCTDEDFYYKNNDKNIKSSEYLSRRWEIYNMKHLNNYYFNLSSKHYKFIDASK